MRVFNILIQRLADASPRTRPARKDASLYPDSDSCRIVPRDQHGISRANISENALKVLYRLKQEGYQSLLVGGGSLSAPRPRAQGL